jgi:hypothetical protein
VNIEQQAELVLATLADASAATLYGFAAGLEHVDGPSSHFHLPVYYLATNRERGEPPDGLTMLTMRSALRAATWKHGEFIEQLENAQSPFWQAVRAALVVLSAECVTV